MEKKVYYKIEYEGGTMNGACRYYDCLRDAVRFAKSYLTRMSHNLCVGECVAVRIARFVNYREVDYYYLCI